MILKALHDYLTGTQAITGSHVTRSFDRAQTFAGLTIVDRNDARRYVRDRVGKEVYASKRPRKGSQHTAVTLRRIATNRVDSTTGGTSLADAIVQIDVWTKGPQAALRAEVTGTLIRLACEGFGGDYWGDVSVADCGVEREQEFIEQPKDGDDWTHRYSQDFQVFYHQPSALVT